MTQPRQPADVVVAGHICIDICPEIERTGPVRFEPGTLVAVGPLTLSTGGCVPNTGIALHRLGATVRLVGRLGVDRLGQIVREAMREVDDHLAADLISSDVDGTSYSVIISPAESDRMFLHFVGANESFDDGDLSEERLVGARILHVGYLPLLRRLYENQGASLRNLLVRAKGLGLLTSMDTAYPDPNSPAGRIDWRSVLREVLPHTDLFLPSYEELHLMLRGGPPPSSMNPEAVRELAIQAVALGAAIVGIKLGHKGFYLRTSSASQAIGAGDWSDRELWSSSFTAHVASTTGAGDAAIAGFLFAVVNGMTPEEAVTAACAVGACSVEQTDATSGIVQWNEIASRLSRGWRRGSMQLGAGWTQVTPGLWTRDS